VKVWAEFREPTRDVRAPKEKTVGSFATPGLGRGRRGKCVMKAQ
jgi:hypothetical protein